MKKNALLLFVLFVSLFSVTAQPHFEEGYFIDSSGQKVACFIKNMYWTNTPAQFSYKLTPDGEEHDGNATMVKEFGVEGIYKFEGHLVKIDRSSSKAATLSEEREPKFEEEVLFLRSVVEGKASLYLYQTVNLVRFFYRIDDSPVQPLIYKQYKVASRVVDNAEFRQQLSTELQCASLTREDFNRLNYDEKELQELFVKYNQCQNVDYKSFKSNNPTAKIHLSLRPGFNYTSLSIDNLEYANRKEDFDKRISFRMGIEAEFVLPMHRNKWSVFVEPTYQRYKSEVPNPEGPPADAKVDYKSIELPIGIRHYFILNEKSMLFANAAYVLDFTQDDSKVERYISGYYVDLYMQLYARSKGSMAFGAGYKFDNKYSVEIRYQSSRDIFMDYVYWDSELRTLSVILGWTLF